MIYNLTGFSDVRIFQLFLVMTSLSCHFLSHGFKLAYFEEFTKGYPACKVFNAVDCLGQVLQRDYKNTMMMSL